MSPMPRLWALAFILWAIGCSVDSPAEPHAAPSIPTQVAGQQSLIPGSDPSPVIVLPLDAAPPFVPCTPRSEDAGDAEIAEESDAPPDEYGADSSDDSEASTPVCLLPHSFCLDENWLVYFEGGQCVDGTCRYTQRVLNCQGSCNGVGCGRAST
jgi:hypothetical protein